MYYQVDLLFGSESLRFYNMSASEISNLLTYIERGCFVLGGGLPPSRPRVSIVSVEGYTELPGR